MNVQQTSLDGVLIIEPQVFRDERGFFTETFNTASLRGSGIPSGFLQDNHSRSTAGVVRGLHYQQDNPQGKLVHVARGSVFDVAVDIRTGSPSFGKWVGVELNDENLWSLWIPPGFAHGFATLSPVADLIYKCTALYDVADERGIAWNDADVGIDWGITNPTVSAKDSRFGTLAALRQQLGVPA